MKQIIINADDFGMCYNYNKGILELAQLGFITSTSVIASRINSAQGEDINKLKHTNISIGLHIEYFDTNFQFHLDRQYQHFIKIFGVKPSHIDLHGATYKKEGYKYIEAVCKNEGIACRKYNNTNLKMITNTTINGTQLSIQAIEERIKGFNEGSYEIFFHPGYKDDLYLSSLQQEREDDIKKIKEIQILLEKYNIKKITYNDL